MSEITKALYSNHINIIRNEAEEIQEYDVINEQDIKELVEYLKINSLVELDLKFKISLSSFSI